MVDALLAMSRKTSIQHALQAGADGTFFDQRMMLVGQ
jgi:hypothetical protein